MSFRLERRLAVGRGWRAALSSSKGERASARRGNATLLSPASRV